MPASSLERAITLWKCLCSKLSVNSFLFQLETSVLVYWPDVETVFAVPLSVITSSERDIGCVCNAKNGKQEYSGKLGEYRTF